MARDGGVPAVSASLASLRRFAEILGDAVIGIDASSTITLWNAAATRLLGYSATEALGQGLDMVIPEELRDAHRRGHQRYVDERTPRVIGRIVELPALHADGRHVEVQLQLDAVEGVEEVRFVAVLRDAAATRAIERARIDEAQAAVRSLEQRYQQLRSVGAALPDRLLVVGLDGRCRAPVEDGELGASTPRRPLGDYVEAAAVPLMMEALSAAVGTGRTSAFTYTSNVSGVTRGLEVRASRLDDSSAVFVVRDVTEAHAQAESVALLSWFQDIAVRFSRAILSAEVGAFDSVVDAVLAEIGEVTSSARAFVFRIDDGLTSNTHEWCAPGVVAHKSERQGLPTAAFDSFIAPLRAGHHVYLRNVSELAPGDPKRSLFGAQGVRSLVALPVLIGERLAGFLGVDGPRLELERGVDLVAPMRLVADILGAALERRRNTAALERERERLAVLLQSASATIYSVRLDSNTVEYVSESIRESLGWEPQVACQPGFWEDALHPDDRARVLAGLGELYRAGRHVHEYRHRHADGTYRWLHDEVRLSRGADGEVVRIVGASFEITERKSGELRIARLSEMQSVVARASKRLLRGRASATTDVIADALGELGRFTRAEGVVFVPAGGDSGTDTGISSWSAEGEGRTWVVPRGLADQLRALGDAAPHHQVAMASHTAAAALRASLGVDEVWVVNLEAHEGYVVVLAPDIDTIPEEERPPFLQLFVRTLQAGVRRLRDEAELRDLNTAASARLTERQRLLALAAALAAAQGLESVWDALTSALPGLLAFEVVCIVEDPAREASNVRVLVGAGGVSLDRVGGVPAWGASVRHVLQSGEIVSTRDRPIEAFDDWTEQRGRLDLYGFVVLPLVARGARRGALCLATCRQTSVTEAELDLITEVGSLISSHLAIWEARDELTRLNGELEARVDARTRALAASESRFARLFAEAPQAMLLVDARGVIISANARAAQVFRSRDVEDLVGLDADILVPSRSRERHVDLRAGYMQGVSSKSLNRVLPALRRDGTEFSSELGLVRTDYGDEPAVIVGVSDVTAREEALSALRRSLDEKETLLREVHHRVKNNLQIVSGLLQMQLVRATDPVVAAPLRESVLRIQSMALVHQSIYGSTSLDRVDLSGYVRRLVGALHSGFDPRVDVELRLVDVYVGIDVAVPLGLCLNELLTNAFKYGVGRRHESSARPTERRTGDADVVVEVQQSGGMLEVAVMDSGAGLPEGVGLETTKSLGLRLVRNLALQLRGELCYDYGGGARFRIRRSMSAPSDG